MPESEYKALDEKIVYGLQVAEREMLEEKPRRGENVIVCGDSGVIRSVPASHYL